MLKDADQIYFDYIHLPCHHLKVSGQQNSKIVLLDKGVKNTGETGDMYNATKILSMNFCT